MAADLQALDEGLQAPPGLTIERVGDAETLQEWYDIAFNGVLGWPDCGVDAVLDYYMSVGLGAQSPRRYYIGRLRGKPVATSALVLGAGVAGIYGVATVSEERGQGIGTAMTLAPLREARALGYRVGVLFTSEKGTPAFRQYHRVGFRQYCKMRVYEWRRETERSGELADAA
jgi:ribosomal protein S18 acetylase RimI-like enzyme